jgi:hypothetical protein
MNKKKEGEFSKIKKISNIPEENKLEVLTDDEEQNAKMK